MKKQISKASGSIPFHCITERILNFHTVGNDTEKSCKPKSISFVLATLSWNWDNLLLSGYICKSQVFKEQASLKYLGELISLIY